MYRIKVIFILTICLLLCGCTQSSQIENQSYVLVMGLDRNEQGQMEMCVQIPKISGGGESGAANDEDGKYMHLQIRAEDFESALEKLHWAVPRELNLAQLKLIVLGRKLAEEPQCREVIEHLAQTERLFTAARVTVCEGNAADFVKQIKPMIGKRVSTDINAMFEYYISCGYIPDGRLADLFYQTESVYSDPMIAYGILEKDKKTEEQQSVTAAALQGSIGEISESCESEVKVRYLGAALFRDGRLVGTLDGIQTVMANLMRNELESFRYKCGGQSLQIIPARPCYVRVDLSDEAPKITINARLSISSQETKPDIQLLSDALEKEIRACISAAQNTGVEPFGFAERAAMKFLTIAEWQAYNWREHFQKADIEVKLSFSRSDA